MGRERAIARPSLYGTDFYGWTRDQAKLLRCGEFRSLDVENIAEEIETLGRSEAAALRSSLRLIVMHPQGNPSARDGQQKLAFDDPP